MFETLEVLLEYEEAAAVAGEQIPPELLDQSPLSIAVNEVIQATMLDEWIDAPQRIIDQLEPKGLINQELSLLLMGKEEPEEEPINTDGMTEEQIKEAERAKLRELNRKKKLALKVLTEDIKLLKVHGLNVRMEHLMEKFARLAPDDPEKIKLMEELASLTKERAALRK